MRKIVAAILLCGLALTANAVPARRGWQTRTQADGTTIEVQVMGDEYYHYLINREGQQVREVNGMYEVVGDAPTPAQAKARHAAAKAKRARKATSAEFGYTPYLPPKGVVIMVNYSDKSFLSSTTKAVIDELCNSENCTVNKYNGVNYGSIGQYFRDQSDGQYNLQLDVYGPVTLDNGYAYYGQDYGGEGNDRYSGDVIIEACKKMDSEIDFSQYDWNNDGDVDFVYVVYAGKGQADGGGTSTIWPHSYDIESSRYYGNCTYSEKQCKFDGKRVQNYAMSNELSGSSLAGIGIICHEYGHVIGLPDHYDTDYGDNYNNSLTPNEWDVMDGGSYNGNIHCPPNYNAWEKAFCGWYTPENLGNEGRKVEMKPIGTDGYSAYQINASGTQQAVTTNESTNYYIECRQQQGWDKFLPAEGMLIWKVNYIKDYWINNEPNLSSHGDPHFTLVIPYGTEIGEGYGAKNVWPYSTKTSWSGVSGKPLKNITKSGNNINLIYIEEPTEPCELTGIALNTNNVQKRFLVDAAFSYTGLVVTAQYSNCANKTVTPKSVSTPDMSTAGEKTVTVSYTEEEVTKTNTYTIEVVEPEIYTIRFFDNGEQIGEDQKVQENQQAQKPANPTPACEDYTFVGWWTEALEADNTQAKSWITNFKATQNQDYYAVYSKTEESEGESGSADFDGVTAGTYKIYGQAGGTKYYAKNSINNNNKLESTTNEAEAAEFTFAKVTDGFTIKTGGQYLKAGSSTNVSLSNTAFTWFIDSGTKGTWRVYSTSNTGRALVFRAGNYNVFGAYATSNINGTEYFDLEIVGESGPSSITYYSTVENCEPTAIEQAVAQPTAIKAIRNGQMVIIRGKEVYSVTGVRIQ